MFDKIRYRLVGWDEGFVVFRLRLPHHPNDVLCYGFIRGQGRTVRQC